jgi:hypothetical protein
MGKWIEFKEQPSKGITKIFKVVSKEGGLNLGTVKWFSAWRCYAFYPESETVFEKACLSDITKFVEDLMNDRKKLKETMKHIKSYISLNEARLNYSNGDVTKMPIIGTITTNKFQWGTYKLPSEKIDVVEIVEDNGKKYYITNKWYKENSVPNIVHEDMVEKYEKKK